MISEKNINVVMTFYSQNNPIYFIYELVIHKASGNKVSEILQHYLVLLKGT